MIDLQPLTTAESTPETHDFGREEALKPASVGL